MEALKLDFNTTAENLNSIYHNSYAIRAIGTQEPVYHPLVKYVSAFKGNQFLGCFMLIDYTDYEIEIHSLLSKKALPYSRDLGKMILSHCFLDLNITRITAPIYKHLHTTKNYVKKLGFKLEGIKRKAIVIENKPVDIEIYGLLREELL